MLDRVEAPPAERARIRTTLIAATRDLLARRQRAERLRAELATAWSSDTLGVERLHALVAGMRCSGPRVAGLHDRARSRSAASPMPDHL